MSVDTFISAVKTKRDEAIDYFNGKIEENNGTLPVEELTLGIDSLISSVLDVAEENIGDIASAVNDDGEDVSIICVSDLSTLYFEEVSN